MITFDFTGKSINRLKASVVCAAKQDTRYYLKGACIDMNTGGCPQLIATDGHRMSVSYVEVDTNAPRDDSQYIIPREILEWIVKIKKATLIRVEFHGTRVEASCNGASISAPLIDARYPDWRRVVNRSDNRTPTLDIGISAEYLGDVAKWQKHLGYNVPNGALFEFDGPSSPIRVKADDENYMVIMPVRI